MSKITLEFANTQIPDKSQSASAVYTREQHQSTRPKSASSPNIIFTAASGQDEKAPSQPEFASGQVSLKQDDNQKMVYDTSPSSQLKQLNNYVLKSINHKVETVHAHTQVINTLSEGYKRVLALRDTKIQSLKAKLEAFHTQEKELKNKLTEQSNHKFNELNEAIAKTNQELQYTSEEIKKLREKLNKANKELAKTEVELVVVNSHLNAKNNAYKELSKIRSAKASELFKLKSEKESSEHKLQAEIARLQKALETQKIEAEEDHMKAQEEITYLKENIKKTPRTLSSGVQTSLPEPRTQKKARTNKNPKLSTIKIITTNFTDLLNSASIYLVNLLMIQSTQRNAIQHYTMDEIKVKFKKFIQSFVNGLTEDKSITQAKAVKEENNQYSYDGVKISKDITSQQFSLDLSSLSKEDERIIMARRRDDPNNQDVIYIKGNEIVDIVFAYPQPTIEDSQYFNILNQYTDNLNDEKITLASEEIYSRPNYTLLNAYIETRKSLSSQRTLVS